MVGRHIDSHRVVREIGRGGMGAVFEAVHDQLGRRAAIKIMLPEFSRVQHMVTRFLNEARAANVVVHPGIVSTYGLGLLPDGTAYIVMEYLEGETLVERLMRRPRLPQQEALRLCRQIASALAAAHKKGVIHRDLKPDNVMIVADPDVPGGERTKILDFGVAKMRAEVAGPAQLRTSTGIVVGTPRYMAPEQCRGVGGIGDRADVYSLGVMLYQMLAGEPVFDAEGIGDLLVLQISAQPRPLGSIVPDVAPKVAALVHAMLCKQPTERPGMAEVALELERLESLPSMPALPPVPRTQPVREVSPSMYTGVAEVPPPEDETDVPAVVPRHRGPLVTVLLTCVLLVSGGLFFLRPWQPAPPPPPPAAENHDPEAAMLLLAADGDLREHRWEEVLLKTDRVLALSGLSPRTREGALLRQGQARSEQAAAADAQRFGAALLHKDFDEAIRAYQHIPPDSFYRPPLKDPYEKAFPLFATAHLSRARAARSAGKCREAQEQFQMILSVEPRYAPALRAKAQPCGEEDDDDSVPDDVPLPAPPPIRAPQPLPVATPAPAPVPASAPAPVPVPAPAQVPVAVPTPAPTPVRVSAPQLPPAAPKPAEEDIPQILREAQSQLGSNPKRAMELARPLTRHAGVRRAAWLVVGAAACKLHELDTLLSAYRQVDISESQFLLQLCGQHGVYLVDGQFQLGH